MATIVDRSNLLLEERLYFDFVKWKRWTVETHGWEVKSDPDGSPAIKLTLYFKGFRDRILGKLPEKFQILDEDQLQHLHRMGSLSEQEQYGRGYEDGFTALGISGDEEVNERLIERSRNPTQAQVKNDMAQNVFYL